MQQERRTIIITGGNSGIGKALTTHLCQQPHTNLVLCSRSLQKTKQTIVSLKQVIAPTSTISAYYIDLSLKDTIVNFVQEIKDKINHIDILVNNAGLLGVEGSQPKLVEGLEETLMANVFGHFYLLFLCLPLMKGRNNVVVNVGSDMHYKVVRGEAKEGEYQEKNIWDLQCKHKKYDNFQQYAISKVFTTCLTLKLHKLLGELAEYKNLQIFSIHPGFVNTNFGSESTLVKQIKIKYAAYMVQPQNSINGILKLIEGKNMGNYNGEYFDQKGNFKEMSVVARDEDVGNRVWDMWRQIYGVQVHKFG